MNIGIFKTCSSLERICLPAKSVLSKDEAVKTDLCLEVSALLTKACLLVNNDNHFGKSPLLLWNWPCSLNSRMALRANQITSNAAVKSRLMKHHLLGRVNKDPKDYHQIAFSFGLQERSAEQSTAPSPFSSHPNFSIKIGIPRRRWPQLVLKAAPVIPLALSVLVGWNFESYPQRKNKKHLPDLGSGTD